jgi:hypothetical protein
MVTQSTDPPPKSAEELYKLYLQRQAERGCNDRKNDAEREIFKDMKK